MNHWLSQAETTLKLSVSKVQVRILRKFFYPPSLTSAQKMRSDAQLDALKMVTMEVRRAYIVGPLFTFSLFVGLLLCVYYLVFH